MGSKATMIERVEGNFLSWKERNVERERNEERGGRKERERAGEKREDIKRTRKRG